MNRRKKQLLVAAAVAAAFLFTAASVGPAAYKKTVNIYDKIRVLNQIISIVNENYVEPVDWDNALDLSLIHI